MAANGEAYRHYWKGGKSSTRIPHNPKVEKMLAAGVNHMIGLKRLWEIWNYWIKLGIRARVEGGGGSYRVSHPFLLFFLFPHESTLSNYMAIWFPICLFRLRYLISGWVWQAWHVVWFCNNVRSILWLNGYICPSRRGKSILTPHSFKNYQRPSPFKHFGRDIQTEVFFLSLTPKDFVTAQKVIVTEFFNLFQHHPRGECTMLALFPRINQEDRSTNDLTYSFYYSQGSTNSIW